MPKSIEAFETEAAANDGAVHLTKDSVPGDPVKQCQSCKPGIYKCIPEIYDWILVCDATGKWQASSYCGKTSKGVGW